MMLTITMPKKFLQHKLTVGLSLFDLRVNMDQSITSAMSYMFYFLCVLMQKKIKNWRYK
jgi:hypothetical protein